MRPITISSILRDWPTYRLPNPEDITNGAIMAYIDLHFWRPRWEPLGRGRRVFVLSVPPPPNKITFLLSYGGNNGGLLTATREHILEGRDNEFVFLVPTKLALRAYRLRADLKKIDWYKTSAVRYQDLMEEYEKWEALTHSTPHLAPHEYNRMADLQKEMDLRNKILGSTRLYLLSDEERSILKPPTQL